MGKTSKAGGNNGGGAVGVILGLAALIGPHISEIIDYLLPRLPKPGHKPKLPEDSNYIDMPNVLNKDFTLDLSKVTELLENYDLKVLSVEVPLNRAGAKYKDCSEFQVVACDKKAKTKLKPGDTVIVQYVTQEVIDESRRIFEEAEQRKAALKRGRAVKRAEQMERAKVVAGDTAAKAKAGVEKMIRRGKKKELGKENSHEQE